MRAHEQAAFHQYKVEMGKHAVAELPAIKTRYTQEKDAKVREAIVYALGEISRLHKGDADVEGIFVAAVSDQDAYVRRSAAFGLGCLESKSAAARVALDKALADDEAAVRQSAAGRWGSSVSRPCRRCKSP